VVEATRSLTTERLGKDRSEAAVMTGGRGDVVSAIEVIEVELPIRRETRWRGLACDPGRWSVVRVLTENGLRGYGEAAALQHWGGDHGRYYGETPTTVRHVVLDLLRPAVIGREPFDIEDILRAMDETVRGYPYAKAAVEMALYDLQGKIAGVPVYKLLGGRARDGVPIALMLGIMSVEDAVEETTRAVDEGIRAIQVKGTGELARDTAVLRAVRSAVGEEITLRLDANQGYRGADTKTIIRAINTLESAGANLVEQPTEGLEQMAAVRAGVAIPVVIDEGCWRAEDVIDVHRHQAADVISIYIAKAGGLARAKRVAAVAETLGYPCDVNGSLESGIGNAANLHFAVSTPRVTLPCVMPISAPSGTGSAKHAGRYYADDVISEPFTFSDGRLYPSEDPGLVTVDEDKLAAYTISG